MDTGVLQQALVEVIQKATTGIESGISFLSSQLPDVIHQLLLYNLVNCIVNIAVPTLIFLVLGCFGYSKVKKLAERLEKDHPYSYDGFIPWFPYVISLILLGILTLGSWCANLSTILCIWLAPKVWLLEYATTLVKGH